MEDIVQSAQSLAHMLINSDIYKNYNDAKAEIKTRPDLLKKIEEYKSLNMRYQLSMIKENENPPSFDDEKRLSYMFQQLIADEKSRQFLESEKKLFTLMERIYDIIGTACKIEFFDC